MSKPKFENFDEHIQHIEAELDKRHRAYDRAKKSYKPTSAHWDEYRTLQDLFYDARDEWEFFLEARDRGVTYQDAVAENRTRLGLPPISDTVGDGEEYYV